ncbi:hypothetical protein ACWDGI_35670 [Streptomyces sp. NPDC001220]
MAVDRLIELRDVDKYHGELHVLPDAGLTVGKGEAADEVPAAVRQLARDGVDRAPEEFLTAPRGERARDVHSEILEP